MSIHVSYKDTAQSQLSNKRSRLSLSQSNLVLRQLQLELPTDKTKRNRGGNPWRWAAYKFNCRKHKREGRQGEERAKQANNLQTISDFFILLLHLAGKKWFSICLLNPFGGNFLGQQHNRQFRWIIGTIRGISNISHTRRLPGPRQRLINHLAKSLAK